MPRFISLLVLLAITAPWAAASDPKASQIPKATGPRVVTKPNPCLQAMRLAEMRDRQLVKEFIPFLTDPHPALAYFTWTYDPGYCLVRDFIPFLTHPQPQLAFFLHSNNEIHRLWMNNQPSVLTIKQLKRAIGQ